MKKKPHKKTVRYLYIGDWLIERGLLTEAQRDEILVIQKEDTECWKRFGEIAVEKGFLTEEAFFRALAEKLRVPYTKLEDIKIAEDIVHHVPESMIKKYCVVPVSLNGRKLTVATAEPLNFTTLEDIKIETELDVFPVVASASALREVIRRMYPPQPEEQASMEEIVRCLRLEYPMAMPEKEKKGWIGKVKEQLTSFSKSIS